jgi:thiosulfate/3-mercaptopyruvate sulfurtransferase
MRPPSATVPWSTAGCADTPVHRQSAPRTTPVSTSTPEGLPELTTKNLVDVRSPDEFSDKILAPAHLPQEQAQRAGHVPSAINGPWSMAANEDGTFKPDEELTQLYGDAGLDGSKSTIAYRCIGERSSHTWVVLHAARRRRRQKLRRQLGRVRLTGRRAHRAG